MKLYKYTYMVVSILFTYTKPFTVEKGARRSCCATPFQHLNEPNTLKFQATTTTVFVGFVVSECWEKTSKTDMSHQIQADISRM